MTNKIDELDIDSDEEITDEARKVKEKINRK